MGAKIAIVDSGYGNLRSVAKAIQHVGGDVVVSADPDVIRKADKVVVPGQGAFRDCMKGLAEHGLDAAIREGVARGVPYLGICLGLQVLFEESEEHGPVAGLGLLAGSVKRFRPSDPSLKVPHMGWNRVSGSDRLWTQGEAYVYFVHSYHVVPRDSKIIALTADYDGPFCAAIRKDNLFACQFHPEKSQRVGLAFLSNFVENA